MRVTSPAGAATAHTDRPGAGAPATAGELPSNAPNQPQIRDPRTAAVVAAWETLAPDTVPALLSRYADDARFRDPFNDVRGHAAIGRILDHMFASLDAPRFTVKSAVTEGEDAFLIWDFSFRRAGGPPMTIHGATHLRFAPDGRVALHRDYWDAAEELYAKLPVIGAVMRWLRARLGSA